LPIQETQTITKETQKAVLKVICESPTLTIEELSTLLKSRGNKISQEEILQVLHSISPSKNWHRATQEDVQKEVLEYLWTLEAQILFLLPTKQKETTIAEFNQIRLQNKQSKVLKDIIRHLQSILTVDGKNLAKFRKFQKDLSFQNDIDINIQTSWLIRRITSDLNITLVTSCQNLPTLIANQLRERFPTISEKAGKTLQRICEKFVEKYFPKNISENKLKEIVTSYQTIFHNYKKGSETETSTQSEFYDQNKLTQNIIETLYEVQNIVKESHEGGALSKLFAGKLRNKEGIIKKIDEVINSLNQVCELSNKSNKVSNEKTLLVQKLQSDYENIVLVKSQLENDLYTQKEKIAQLEEKVSSLDKDQHDKAESLEKAHEKIAAIGQKLELIPELEAKANMLREELNIAKDIALRLYRRVGKIKSDLLKQHSDKTKNNKSNAEQKSSVINNVTIHKFQQDEVTGQTTITTETTSNAQ